MTAKKLDDIEVEISYLMKTHELMCEIDILKARILEIENNLNSVTSILKQHQEDFKKLIELTEDHEGAYQYMTVNLSPRTEELEKSNSLLSEKLNKYFSDKGTKRKSKYD